MTNNYGNTRESTEPIVELGDRLAEQLNPLRDIGEMPRGILGWIIAAFAVLFALPVVFCPITFVVMALQFDLKVAGFVACIMLIEGLCFAVPLFWLAKRLLRKHRTGVMVLPLWLFRVMGVVFLAGACLFAYHYAFTPSLNMDSATAVQMILAQAVIGAGMLAVPMLVKRSKQLARE
jgi:hypothetical protein